MRNRGTVVAAFLMILASDAAADGPMPAYPPEMRPAANRALPVVTIEPTTVADADGRKRIVTVSQGNSLDDIPRPADTVESGRYASWMKWPLGTVAWWDAESLGEHGRRDHRRRVDRLDRAAPEQVYVKEFWATQEGKMDDGSGRGMGAQSSPAWDLIPRRGGDLVAWRVYRARVTVSDAAGPTTRPAAASATLVNADGYVRPEGVTCTVVEWCERRRAPAGQPAPDALRFTREVRHPWVPDGAIQFEFGTATLDAAGEIAEPKVDHRIVLDRVLPPAAQE